MFDSVLEDFETAFASATWTSNNIKTFPDNYQGKVGANVREYVQIKLLPSSSENYAYAGRKELTGLLAVKIFVAAGEGQGRLMAIGDFLDILLQNKTLTNGTRLGTSYLQVEGLDAANKSLYSGSYFIPFTRYGE